MLYCSYRRGDTMIQPEYDLLKKIAESPTYTDDDFTRDEYLYLKNCESENWAHCRDKSSFTWAITSRGEAAMKRFEYEQQQQAERDAYAKRKDRRDLVLQVLAVLFGALGVIFSVAFALVGHP